MIELVRTVRFCVSLGSPPDGRGDARSEMHNTFSAWPTMAGLGAHYEIDVRCRGQIDARTGYLMSITDIDRAVRDSAIPIIQRRLANAAEASDPVELLPVIVGALQPRLERRVHSVEWRLSPYYSLGMNSATPHQASVSQQFEFAASHRLHSPQLSDEENRRVFGKCNSPNGHGHNYRLSVCVAVPVQAEASGSRLGLEAIERIVDETVIRRFDHKHLNLDTLEFASLNPSVENIAKVCFELLRNVIDSGTGARLIRVTVWETEKTSSTYPSEG